MQLHTGWRQISEIMYDSTVTSVWLLVTFSAYWRLTRCVPFDKMSVCIHDLWFYEIFLDHYNGSYEHSIIANCSIVAPLSIVKYVIRKVGYVGVLTDVCFWLRKELKKSQSASVCLVQTCLELSIFIFLSQVSLRSVSGQSQVSPRSVPGQYQVILRSLWAYFVSKSEPKILRLVVLFLRVALIYLQSFFEV